jgi:ferredoxin
VPSKYMIHTRPVPHRFEPITRSGVIAWEEGCLKCAVCVKTQCVYGVYDNRSLESRQMIDSTDNRCMNCLRCVQSCPKELIHKSLNPQFKAMGDAHWSPDVIAHLWYQAETGKIPVSGAGYPGPFSGPGFDSMWTDMSEIVRPTRDGIHGREYISTAVDLGKTPAHLSFSKDGDLVGDEPVVVNIPLPILMRVPSFGAMSTKTLQGWVMAAKRLGTLMALPHGVMGGTLSEFAPWLVPVVSSGEFEPKTLPPGVRLVELPWSENWAETVQKIKATYPSMVISLRLPMVEGVEEKAISAVRGGAPILHLEASQDGRFVDHASRTLKEGIRSVHLKLVGANLREGVTLLVSGGLTMAEHVAKALICGADAVFTDFPILIALECRMCKRCTKDLSCPVDIADAPASWVAGRTVNLVGAWHNQLLEVMGAMGIRDARRLRGEVGRGMFFEELDKGTFGSLGAIEEGYEIE